jgi:hypothetical protein
MAETAYPQGFPVRVFISYAWEDVNYRRLVKKLATRLRNDGVDARLDAWHLRGTTIPEFMNREVRLASKFGPHIGASPVALLSVIGRNMPGRLQVAPPEAALDAPAKPIEVAVLLKGDNSEETFSRLVREHAKSGVLGVLPKFLDTDQKKQSGLGPHKKASLLTREHIIKGSSSKLPFATANEHLCMQVAARVVECAKTELSGWQSSGSTSVRRRREWEAVPSIGRFLCATRTSAIREVRNHMGANREGGSDLSAGRRSARDLPEADHNPAVDVRAEER